jgi:hypothetical protein
VVATPDRFARRRAARRAADAGEDGEALAGGRAPFGDVGALVERSSWDRALAVMAQLTGEALIGRTAASQQRERAAARV